MAMALARTRSAEERQRPRVSDGGHGERGEAGPVGGGRGLAAGLNGLGADHLIALAGRLERGGGAGRVAQERGEAAAAAAFSHPAQAQRNLPRSLYCQHMRCTCICLPSWNPDCSN